MYSAEVLLCVCVCRIRVRVRTCNTTSPSSRVPAVQIPSITCVCRCVHGTAYTLRTQHGHSSVCMYSGVHTTLAVCVVHTCVAQQYSCVFTCVGYAYVLKPTILPHLPPAFLRCKSLPAPVHASSPMYVCVSSYGCASCNKCLCLSARYILHLGTT